MLNAILHIRNHLFQFLRVTHVFAIQFKAVCLVNNPVKTCICIGIVSKQVIPGFDWQLWNDDRRLQIIPTVDHFKEVPAFIEILVHQSEIINDQHVKAGHVIYIVKVGSLDPCLVHFAHHGIGPDVFDSFELPDCRNTQCIWDIWFSCTCSPGHTRFCSLVAAAFVKVSSKLGLFLIAHAKNAQTRLVTSNLSIYLPQVWIIQTRKPNLHSLTTLFLSSPYATHPGGNFHPRYKKSSNDFFNHYR